MSDLIIKESTLSSIGDALRRRHGETRLDTVVVEEVVPSVVTVKTPNFLNRTETDSSIKVNYRYTETVAKTEANKFIIDLSYKGNGLAPIYIIKGSYNSEDFPINEATKYASGGVLNRETITIEDTDSITICFNGNDNNPCHLVLPHGEFFLLQVFHRIYGNNSF